MLGELALCRIRTLSWETMRTSYLSGIAVSSQSYGGREHLSSHHYRIDQARLDLRLRQQLKI